jgi:2-polyprenyl-3-methyl-5-hydroxy-6-metoxy-1,4-benzoquinol methylase
LRETALHYLACPRCYSDLAIRSVEKKQDEILEEAQLTCVGCQASYPVVRCIPRFVANENYASGFGFEWTMHARTQYDSYNGTKLSEQRFFEETGWPKDLSGETILEVGSGSGRFTEQAAATGAFVVSLDYSYAVEANYASNGARQNVLIVQGDIYSMPFRTAYFDKVFCFGMLQHTPDVHKAFLALPPMLKPDGELVVDIYKKSFFRTYVATKYYVRGLTRNIEAANLYQLTRRWIDLMWPFSRLMSRIPWIGSSINWRLLIPDYSKWGLQGSLAKEWAYLDAFDMLSPRYDAPQRIKTLSNWFQEARMADIVVRYGFNGIEGRGKRCHS